MNKNAAYQDYKSIWQNKPAQAIKDEIHVISKYTHEVDKYLDKDQLTSTDKLDILNGILKKRG